MTWADIAKLLVAVLPVLALAGFLIERIVARKRNNGRHNAGSRVNGLGRGKKETDHD